jgi:hypothetical protein
MLWNLRKEGRKEVTIMQEIINEILPIAFTIISTFVIVEAWDIAAVGDGGLKSAMKGTRSTPAGLRKFKKSGR